MVIDTSAIAAIILGEPEREFLLATLLGADAKYLSASSVLEIHLALRKTKGLYSPELLDGLLRELQIEIVSFDLEQAKLAREAFDRFGKGRHPARLNYGDCMVYALAMMVGEPLLFKGSDFALTDIVRAGV